MEVEKAKHLAEQIALLFRENEKETGDFAILRAGLEKINERLDKIEAKFDSQNSNDFHPSPFIIHPSITHPSQEKFAVLEAVADDLDEQHEMEKPCPYEPTGKPCDHCSMCNSRGF